MELDTCQEETMQDFSISLAMVTNGMRFDNRCCWIVYFRRDPIVRVRAYLDSAMIARLFVENSI
jgi:ketosteroid isomerase-like protein